MAQVVAGGCGHKGRGSLGEARVGRAVPGGLPRWDAAPTCSLSSSFSRDSPGATSAIAAQSLAAVPHSSRQCCGAGSRLDTMKGQRGAFWEAAEQGHQSKPPVSLSCAPATRATFPRGFGMKLLPLDWHGQKGSQGPCLAAWCLRIAVPSPPGMKGSALGWRPQAWVPSALSL